MRSWSLSCLVAAELVTQTDLACLVVSIGQGWATGHRESSSICGLSPQLALRCELQLLCLFLYTTSRSVHKVSTG